MRHSTILQLVAVLAIAACGTEPTDVQFATMQLDIIAGDSQVGTVAQELATAITVEVLAATAADGPEAPLAGQLVNFVVVEGEGEVFAGAALTDSLGRAADRWTLGTLAGVQRLEVRAVQADGTPIVFATARATAAPGPLASSRFVEDTIHVLGAASTAIGIVAHDAYGNDVDPPTPILSSPAFGSAAGGAWTPTWAGRAVLRLVADSLIAFVYPPVDALTVTRVVAETVYVETGTLVLDQVEDNHTHAYALINARSIRTTPLGADTVTLARGWGLFARQNPLRLDVVSIRSDGFTSAWSATVQDPPLAAWRWQLGTAAETLVIRP